jgi:zinc/manganese transport system ATP-binding protein
MLSKRVIDLEMDVVQQSTYNEGKLHEGATEAQAAGQAVLLQGATMEFEGHTIWRDATLSIAQGEFIAVLGPNGSGKTTLLRVLLGMLRLSEGQVHVWGEPPHRGNRAIGYVPQRRTLDPDLPIRGRDLVMLGIEGLHWGFPLPGPSLRKRKSTVEEALASVEAIDYADRPIGQISGGEQQRLLLAQALVGRPRLLLLDEPLANLDMRNQEAITQLVAGISRADRITVLLVSHDINPVLPVMDRVIYLVKEHMIIGTPDQVITSETLTKLYDAPIQVVRDSQGHYLCSGRID